MNQKDRTVKAMTLLLENSKEVQQDNFRKLDKTKSPLVWLKEYCTVAVKGPRGSGHSDAIVEIAREMMDRGMKVAVISPNIKMKGSLKRLGTSLMSTMHSVRKLKDEHLDAVFVDVASIWPKKTMEDLYYVLRKQVDPMRPRAFYIILVE